MVLLEPLRDQKVWGITPQGPLEQSDFEMIARALDPVIVAKARSSA